MKRTLSFTLAAAPAAAKKGLSGSPKNTEISPRITLTSSDGANAAGWLTARLGEAPDRVVIGTESDGYGVDVSALEDDGYFIRALGDKVAILAKTADGLDRAVRRYAKTVEAGETVADETYHEGARIGRLTIAGNDISTYAICVEGGNEYWRGRVEKEAAGNLSELIGIACGFAPKVGGEAEHTILFRWIEDETFSEGTFRYFVKNGDLAIEFTELLGAKYAMRYIVEEELGWIDLTAGFDCLPEAEHIDVPEGREVTLHPMFDFYTPTINDISGENSHPATALYNYYNRTGHGAHGLLDRRFRGIFPSDEHEQPCLTDPTLRENTVEVLIEDFIEPQLAAGKHIGDELTNISLGQRDGDVWCQCSACKRAFKEEGTMSGVYLRWVNAIDDEVDAAGYDGIAWNILAYVSTIIPPKKTVPHGDVQITVCMTITCDKHLLDGSQCQWDLILSGKMWNTNKEMCEWIAGWAALTDNLFVYCYALDCGFTPHCMLDTLYEDNVTFKKLGARNVKWECANYTSHYYGTKGDGKPPQLGFYMIMQALSVWHNLHPDATKEDFLDHYHITLERLYGDGWRDVARFIELWNEAELAVKGCSHCWGDSSYLIKTHLDPDTFFASWDEMIALLESAARQASDAGQEERVLTLLAQAYYTGCLLGYDDAVEAHDEAKIALLSERYGQFAATVKKMGYGLAYNYLTHWRVYGETIDGMIPVHTNGYPG